MRFVAKTVRTGHEEKSLVVSLYFSVSCDMRLMTGKNREGRLGFLVAGYVTPSCYDKTGVRTSKKWVVMKISPCNFCRIYWQTVKKVWSVTGHEDFSRHTILGRVG